MASALAEVLPSSGAHDSVVIHLDSDNEEFFDANSVQSSPTKMLGAEDGAAESGKPPLTEEEKKALLNERVLALVDFYFGDSNYSKDQFLRKQATLDITGSGWISVDVVASFKKMKKLTEDRDLILACIRQSKVVELNADETFLKRRDALLKDLEDTYAKTILIGNLSPAATADSIKGFCSNHGTVVRVRYPFQSRDELPESVRQVCMEENGNGYLKTGVKIEQKSLYAMVEYATIKQAAAAVKSLLSDRDWRTEIFATLLFKRLKCDSPAVSEPSSQNPSRTASPFLQSSSSLIVERARANSFNARLLRERTMQNDGNTIPSPSPSQSHETTPTSWRDRSNSCNTRPRVDLRTLADASSPPSVPCADNSIFRTRANSLNSRPSPAPASNPDSARSWRAGPGGPAASRSPSASPHVARRHLSPDVASGPIRVPVSTPRSTTLSHTESPSSTWTTPNLVIRQPAGPDGTRGFARRAPEPHPQQSCAA